VPVTLEFSGFLGMTGMLRIPGMGGMSGIPGMSGMLRIPGMP